MASHLYCQLFSYFSFILLIRVWPSNVRYESYVAFVSPSYHTHYISQLSYLRYWIRVWPYNPAITWHTCHTSIWQAGYTYLINPSPSPLLNVISYYMVIRGYFISHPRMTIQDQLSLPLSDSAFASAFVPKKKIERNFIYETRRDANTSRTNGSLRNTTEITSHYTDKANSFRTYMMGMKTVAFVLTWWIPLPPFYVIYYSMVIHGWLKARMTIWPDISAILQYDTQDPIFNKSLMFCFDLCQI